MRKFLFLTIIFFGFIFFTSAQTVNLSGIYDSRNAMVTLTWNMVSNPVRTTYLLLRSSDGISWTEAMKDKIPRNYTEDDMYTFNDKKFFSGSNYYRIRISDADNNMVALSPIIKVNTAFINTATSTPRKVIVSQNNFPSNKVQQENYNNDNNSGNWAIYPNPATDFLYLNYKGKESLKGIVNIAVIDGSGKTVIKFRSGSMYNKVQVPLTYLQRGVYFVQVMVLDKVMMNQRFIKQ